MEQKVKEYWEERASQNKNAVTGTTNDVYLRELEVKTFCDSLVELGINNDSAVLDVGCGDGYTTLSVAKNFPESRFTGIDYSENMIENASINLKEFPKIANVFFKVADATNLDKYFEKESFDFVLSDRCLINLENSKNQYDAISKISSLLKPGGYYIAIENFVEGQDNLNEARKKMGLNEIPIRWHNCFFQEKEFVANVSKYFSSVRFVEFCSAYYYATRVVYSALCKYKNVEPDYLDDIHKISVNLPIMGAFSPIRLAILKK